MFVRKSVGGSDELCYIRIFDNNGKSFDDAIKCWKYKKSMQGHSRYEKSDLMALSCKIAFYRIRDDVK